MVYLCIMEQQQQQARRGIYWSLAGNVFLALAKGVTGLLGNSFALLADAIESSTDVFSSLLVLLGLRYAHRPPDANHPYGHGKAEPLTTFGVVVFLVASAAIIIYQGIHNIRHEHELPAPFTLIVLGAIIVIKETFYRLVKRRGQDSGSSTVAADAWHHRSDAITSLAAFLGIGLALLLGPEYAALDDWAALVAAGIILYNAYRIFRPALGEVMDEHRYDALEAHIRRQALAVPGIQATEKCYVRKLGMQYWVDLHAQVGGHLTVDEGHALAHRLKDHLQAQIPQLAEVHIHVEPVGPQHVTI